MAQSLNTKSDLVMDATSYSGLNSYGKIMIGDRAFEYYNNRKVEDYIQIPWKDVDYVIASVMFGGKYIPRFVIRTKQGRDFPFAAKHPKELLRAIRNYVPSDRMVRSLTLMGVLRRRFRQLFNKA
ncbi:MAG: DUF956 family protein [Clostridiales bacterium]|nr:DUF956 family protein [Clostridiales bacterium]